MIFKIGIAAVFFGVLGVYGFGLWRRYYSHRVVWTITKTGEKGAYKWMKESDAKDFKAEKKKANVDGTIRYSIENR